jgi:hypothetical protein
MLVALNDLADAIRQEQDALSVRVLVDPPATLEDLKERSGKYKGLEAALLIAQRIARGEPEDESSDRVGLGSDRDRRGVRLLKS